MIKDIMEANNCMSPNDKELTILKENFPSCFRTDGSFDMVRFSEYLKDKIDITHEGYELKFLGKSYAKMLASLDTETVIVPDDSHNSLPENKNSENIYISGDNLDGLKHLLKSYAGEVKCIYIDPPYNTGSDGFVYNDKFNFTVNDLVTKLSIDEEQAQRILDLTKRGSASHSAWLMFMYPRLVLARDLLTDDGVIFISIDDNECHNLKLLCDDIFGEENFIAEILREAIRGGSKSKNIRNVHDYILCYARKIDDVSFGGIEKDGITLDLEDEHGKYAKGRELNKWGAGSRREDSPTMYYPIKGPNNEDIYPIRNDGSQGRWRLGRKKMAILLENNNAIFSKREDGTYIVYEKIRDDSPKIKQFTTWFSEKYINAKGTEQLKTLFNTERVIFDYSKPTVLIEDLLIMATENDEDIILDFFSGSATAAHAVMNLNAEDGGNRKFIMVQLPEIIEEGKPAYEAGYRTIDQIGMDRIIKAANKIKEENPDTAADLGFKHYTLQDVSDSTLDRMESFDDSGFIIDTSIYDQFGANTILTTWLVRDGYGFNSDVEMVNLGDYIAYWSHNHLYFINPGLTEDAIKALIDRYNSQGNFNPQNIILFGYNFTYVEMENIKTNVKILRDSEKNLKINLDIRY